MEEEEDACHKLDQKQTWILWNTILRALIKGMKGVKGRQEWNRVGMASYVGNPKQSCNWEKGVEIKRLS